MQVCKLICKNYAHLQTTKLYKTHNMHPYSFMYVLNVGIGNHIYFQWEKVLDNTTPKTVQLCNNYLVSFQSSSFRTKAIQDCELKSQRKVHVRIWESWVRSKEKQNSPKISITEVFLFSTDLFRQEFVHGLIRGNTPTLINRCCTHDTCSVFHKMTFQNGQTLYSIIYIIYKFRIHYNQCNKYTHFKLKFNTWSETYIYIYQIIYISSIGMIYYH